MELSKKMRDGEDFKFKPEILTRRKMSQDRKLSAFDLLQEDIERRKKGLRYSTARSVNRSVSR